MPNILYIDPEEERSEMIKNSLSSHKENIEVITAQKIKEAVEHSKEDIDVVVSREDINGTPAYNLFQQLKSEWPETPFILFTDKNVNEIRITEPTIIADYVDTKRENPIKRLENHIKSLTEGAGMSNYPLPDDEEERVAVFERYRTINKDEQEALDGITTRLKNHFEVSTAFIGLISRDKEIYISKKGWENREGSRCDTVCTFTILDSDVLVVHDLTEDERFKEIQQLKESGLKWYAGMPLKNKDGVKIGAICLMDEESHDLSDEDINILEEFAKEAEEIFKEVRRHPDD